jgi:hypothetical protein
MTTDFLHGWVFNESRALVKKLQGITVQDATSPTAGRVVPVTFVHTEWNMSDATYPGIYIEYGGIYRATDREHRGPTTLPYAPDGFPGNDLVPADMEDPNNTSLIPWILDENSNPDPNASPYWVQDVPVPFNLDFQVSVRARNYEHSFQIVNALADRKYLPERFGYLEVPEDGTVRTLELTGGPEVTLDKDQDGKTIVLSLYSVRVASEKSLYEIERFIRATQVVFNLDGLTQSP